MADCLDEIFKKRISYSGTMFLCKSPDYSPAEPSGHAGRYNGEGTNTYYLGNSPEACWREITNANPEADPRDYRMWSISVTGTFIDVGALDGSAYTRPREDGGWEPGQQLAQRLKDETVYGFQFASQPAKTQGESGTCFCIYQSVKSLVESEFHSVDWWP